MLALSDYADITILLKAPPCRSIALYEDHYYRRDVCKTANKVSYYAS